MSSTNSTTGARVNGAPAHHHAATSEVINGVSESSYPVANGVHVNNSESPQPTANGGYSHTAASRAKISAANKGKTPWNKGRQRSEQERARIAAGVRARNRERFLQKLQDMGLTEEEYEAQKKQERRRKEAERRARRTEKGGYRPTEKTKQKISQILKQKWANDEISKRSVDPSKIRRGFTHTHETRAKISESLRKRWAQDEGYRMNMLNKTHTSNSSPDVRAKISAALKKKWEDPEFRTAMLEKMSKRRKPGGPHDETHRAKISAAMKAKWQDEDYRAKTVASIQRRASDVAARPQRRKPATKVPKKAKAAPSKPSAPKKLLRKVVKAQAVQMVTPVQPKTIARKKEVAKKLVKKNTEAMSSDKAAAVNRGAATQKKVSKAKVYSDITTEPVELTPKPVEPDGSINRLREERRDLYDLLYGDDAGAPALGDESLDTFDPYGLEDF